MRMKTGCTRMLLSAAIAIVAFPCLAQNATSASPAGQVRTVQIQAKKFQFEPSEITLKKDQSVTLELTSADVEHSLVVPGLGIRGVMKKGETTDVQVTPTKTGDFRGKCGKFCGMGHGKMHFIVHVIN
ncbi:MAG TPA: cupredoxin domain-containing protein [Acidobacteriaceae bacterium]|nr:cupredoxin domain-containing protein [Acidobacteriaceae bacterium]